MPADVKTPKHSLQNKFKIWNIDEKKYQKMEVTFFFSVRLLSVPRGHSDFYIIVYIPYWSNAKSR